MKKLFAIIMSMLMIACFMPTMAFAEGIECTSQDCTHEAAIGTTHYATLSEAITKATNGQTVKLLKNATGSGLYLETTNEEKQIIVDFNNKTYTVNGLVGSKGTENQVAHFGVGNTVTIKNGTLQVADSVSGNAKILIQNYCDLTASNMNFNGRNLKLAGQTHYTLSNNDGVVKFEDCTVTASEAEESVAVDAAIWGDYKGADVTLKNCIVRGKLDTAKYQYENGKWTKTADLSTKSDGTPCIKVEGGSYTDIYHATLAASNGTTITLLDNVTLPESHLTINVDKAFTIDLGGKTLTGRTDIKQGNVTIKNGTVTNTTQPLNVYGSTDSSKTNYSVLTISKDVNVSATEDVVCMMSIDYGTAAYGAVINIEGTVTATKTGASGEAAVFVSGNIGNDDAQNIKNMSENNVVNISGNVIGGDIMAVAMNGQATVNVKSSAKISGSTGIGVKRGILKVEDGATVEATGEKVDPATANMNGAENTGAAISVTSSYNAHGSIDIDVNGGTIKSKNNVAFYVGHSSKDGSAIAFAKGMTVSLDGGSFVGGADGAVFVADKMAGDANTYTKAIINGGSFSEKPDSAYLAANAKVYKTNVGLYQVNDETHTSGYNTWTKNSDGIYIESYVSRGSSGSSSSSSTTTTTTTDTVTNTTEDKKTDTSADTGSTTGTTTVATTTATVKTETKTATDGTKTVAATVDSTTATKIVEKAVENKSEEVVIDTATATTGTTTVTETAAGTTTKVDLPEQTVKAIAEKTEAAVTIKSDAAEIKLDTEAVKAVAEQAGDTGTVNLVVETVAQNESKVEVDLKLVTSKGNVSDFKGGNVTVTVKLNTKLAAKPVVCVYIDDNGTYHKVKGVKNADGTYTFETGHFSTYAVMEEEEADKVIAEQTANVEKMAKALSLKARSAKTKAGNIKVTLTTDNDKIKAITDLGYTVKYKFYRSTKKAKGYKATVEKAGKTYTNTTGKKGTKYYYKARVMVYDAQGELIAKSALTQCKYASRTR